MLTAAIRDLKRVYPTLSIYVQCLHPAVFENNYNCTILPMGHPVKGTKVSFDYGPYLQASPQKSGHFLDVAYTMLEKTFNIQIPRHGFRPEVYLTEAEKAWRPIAAPYWVLVCGGKTDFTTKWWSPLNAKKLVDTLKGEIQFVQIGEVSKDPSAFPAHQHFPIEGAENWIGKTNLRQLISTIYNSEGVVCPVTAAMHIAAAVPKRGITDRLKPCVVIAGGREPPHWEAYPGHKFLHTIGELDCCREGPCWARRAQLIPDASTMNTSQLCHRPVQVTPELRVAECMNSITGEEVANLVRRYARGYTPLPVLNSNSIQEEVIIC